MVPQQYQALWTAGKLIRRGALLIDPKAGRIVAHLQETAKFANGLGGATNPVSLALQVAQQGLGAVNTFQLEQVKSRLDTVTKMLGLTTTLQKATLATSVVGIGVSAAGTALVCQRIEGLRDDVTRLGNELSKFRDEWRLSELQTLLDKAMTRVERIGTAHVRTDQGTVLQEAETVLHDVFNASASRGKLLLAMDDVPIEVLQIIMNALLVSGAARVKALFLLEEAAEAKKAASSQVERLAGMTLAAPTDVLASKLTGVENAQEAAEQVSSIFSEARLQSASIPSLVDHLTSIDNSTREHVMIADTEEEAPLLFLPIAD